MFSDSGINSACAVPLPALFVQCMQVLKQIFGSIFTGFLRAKVFAEDIKALADKITLSTVEVCLLGLAVCVCSL